MREKLGLVLISTVLGICLAEAAARVFLVVRNIGPAFSTYDAYLGKVHKKSFSAIRTTPEFQMTFTTNSDGFRGEKIDWTKGFSVATLLFVGDSYTEGYGVNDGEEFPSIISHRLERDCRDVPRVINAGIGDTGTGHAYKFLRQWSAKHPSHTLLIYQVSANDFEDDWTDGRFQVSGSGQIVEAEGAYPKSTMRYCQPVLESIPGLGYSHLYAAILESLNVVANLRSRKGESATKGNDEADRLTFGLLDRLLRTAAAADWPAIVLTFGLGEARQKGIEAVCLRNQAVVVRIPDKQTRPELYYRIDGHWNRAGHAFVADIMVPAIEAKIHCNPIL